MHDTAAAFGAAFFRSYVDLIEQPRILEIGASDVNGSLRGCAPPAARYTGIDLAGGPGVDLVLADPYVYPFDTESFDAVVSSSCMEHDPMFWLSFAEMCRVVQDNGYIYLNAPSNGWFHRYPTDNWRFYPDAGEALAEWGRRNGYDIRLLESFIGRRRRDIWNDCVMVFGKGKAVRPPHPLADLFPRSLNIRIEQEQGFRNHCDQTEDMILQHWMAEKLKIVPDADAEPVDTALGGMIAALAEREVALGAAERNAAEQVATAKARLAEETRLRAEAEQRAANTAEEARQRTDADARAAQAERRFAEELQRRAEAERRLAEELRQRAEAERQAAVQRLAAQGAELARLEGEREGFLRERDAVLSSTFWRLTGPARRSLGAMPPGLRRQARRGIRLLYWIATPHRTRQRIAYLRSRPGAVATLSVAALEPPATGGRHPEVARWTETPAGFMILCQELLQSGRMEHAERIARTAVERFPQDRELGQFWRKFAIARALQDSGLFDPTVYRSMHHDLSDQLVDPWAHFVKHGLDEGRQFTNCEIVGRVLAEHGREIERSSREFKTKAERAFAADGSSEAAALLRRNGVRIGIFCSSEGNFFMEEIANLLAWGLQDQSITVVQRDEKADLWEPLDLRIFVAPQEYFTLGRGREWMSVLDLKNTILFNVDQVQSSWFCRAFPLLSRVSLVLDINFQSTEILRRAGCNAIHVMPGHVPYAPYARPYKDVSDVELLKGYDFARRPYNWLERNRLEDRPIDILFVGTQLPRRDQALSRLQEILAAHRFICVTTPEQAPMTARNHRATSTEINCALGQRAKIVLNIHRDWLGYFEWSRMVLQGFWQGACVVSDPCLPHPIFEAGTHYLEESTRHIGELIRWLLDTREGLEELGKVRSAGHRTAATLGSMRVALEPALEAFVALLPATPSPNELLAPPATRALDGSAA